MRGWSFTPVGVKPRADSISVYPTMIYDKLYILRLGIPNYRLVPIDGWDVEEAKNILKKYDDAYGFRFQRRMWAEDRSDGRLDIIARIMNESGTYYINGFIETLDDIRARIELNRDVRRTQDDMALLQRLESRGAKAIYRHLTNDKICCIFNEETDVLL